MKFWWLTMIYETPHFIIRNKFQKRDDLYQDILSNVILKDICLKTTGESSFATEFVNDSYNKGRLATIRRNDVV